MTDCLHYLLRCRLWAVLLSAGAQAAAAGGASPGLLVSGSRQALFVARYARQPGPKGQLEWQTAAAVRSIQEKRFLLLEPFSGRIHFLAAAGNRAYVFFDRGRVYCYWRDSVTAQPQSGVQPTLPEGRAPVAVGVSSDAAELWLVARIAAPTTRPSSGPGTRSAAGSREGPRRSEVRSYRLMRLSERGWRDAGALPAGLQSQSELEVCGAGGSVYVTGRGRGRPAAVAVYKRTKGRWEELEELALPSAGCRILALAPVNRRPFAVLAEPLGAADNRVPARIRVMPIEGGAGVSPPLAADDGGGELTVPVDSVAAGGAFGDSVVVAYSPKGDRVKVGRWRVNGAVVWPVQEVSELSRHPRWEVVRQGVQTAAMILLIVMMVLVWVGKREAITRPAVFPEGTVPAPLLRRGLALGLDILPSAALAGLIWRDELAGFSPVWEFSPGGPETPLWFWLLMGSISVFYAVYCGVCELALRTTPGKLLLQMRVVGVDGKRATVGQILIRNAVRAVEVSWLFGLAMVVFPLITPNRQRVGDVLANTIVVHQPVHWDVDGGG